MDPKFLLAIALTLPLCAQVKITAQGKEKISVEIDGKPFTDFYRSEERRVGKECRSRWSPYH